MTDKLAGFFTQPENRRILVVDDEAEILQIMEEFLLHSFPESQIVTADDGQEALKLAMKNQFDIICTDHRMPIMSGAEFVNHIRRDSKSPNQHTPILFVTSFIDDAKKSIKFREDIFFLNKPFDSTNLVLYVDSVILKSALDAASQRQKLLKLERDFYQKQTRIIQRARVASYSEFSSGIAHELNNPLAVIEGLAYILEQEQGTGKVQEYSQKIIENVSRMKAIINHLRSFANLDQSEDLSALAVNELLQNSPMLFLERMKSTGIKFELNLSPDDLWVKANKLQLERVFQILILNSIEAYERNPTIENRSIAIASELDKGDEEQVRISFTDRAGGIPEHLKTKIFDPFITSKNEVTGVGFGLSIAWGVVTSLGGEIEIEEGNGGANFHISLPAVVPEVKGQSEDVSSSKHPEGRNASKDASKLKVLIVDDEEAICDLLKCYLEEAFQVHQTSSASAAIKMAASTSYDLVISDFKMPEMDGIVLSNEVITSSPKTKFILISGHLVSIESLDFAGDRSHLGFISKPFGDPGSIVSYIEEFLA